MLSHSQCGFALVTVLLITAIGLLFGAGSLLLFRYQCQMRIDRQHELEKMYSVRSALNYLRMETITDPGKMFHYHTGSDRDLGVFIKPATPFFPSNRVEATEKKIEQRHFVMEWGDFYIPPEMELANVGYNSDRDYEYGAEGVTNLCVAIMNKNDKAYGIVFNCQAVPSDCANMKCWVNIGMRGTGGWLQEDYGRRYCFYLREIYGADVVRLWLIRDPLSAAGDSDGRKFGWPPSDGEGLLMAEVCYEGGDLMMKLFECEGKTPNKCLCKHRVTGSDHMGIQLAHDKVALFSISNKYTADTHENVILRGFKFSNVETLSDFTYKYYFSGSKLDEEGKIVKSPDLRAVFQIDADANERKNEKRVLQNFKVIPGYQYDVSLVYPKGTTNLATVAQRMGEIQYGQDLVYSVFTYDTHGTENKGFRKDEREAERRRQEQGQ